MVVFLKVILANGTNREYHESPLEARAPLLDFLTEQVMDLVDLLLRKDKAAPIKKQFLPLSSMMAPQPPAGGER